MKTFNVLLKTELKLLLRGMDMVIFGIAAPIIITVILGLIMQDKPAYDGAEYSFMQQSFGALASIGICASGLMGLPLTVADYRNKKVLKRFKVTPVSPTLLLFVQFILNMGMAIISLIGVYLVCAIFFNVSLQGSIFMFIIFYLLVLISIFSMGMMVASVSPNIKTANLVCSLLYFPMLLFSGATIPYEIMPKTLQSVMSVLPLTQGIKLMKGVVLNHEITSNLTQIAIILIIAILCTGVSLRFFKWE